MRSVLLVFWILVCGLASAQNGEEDLAALDAGFAKGVLIVHSSKAACYALDIYVAENPAQRARGLMNVRHLPDMTGMLFIYDVDGYLSMWMKNTFIPLDMLFIRADGTVSSIAYNTEPRSLKSVAALEPVRYVLELNAGMADKLGLDKYSRVEWDGMPR